MSEISGDDASLIRQPPAKALSPAKPIQVATPVKSSFDAFLASAGWQYSDLTPTQLRLLAGLLSERHKLLETIQVMNDALEDARTDADHDAMVPVYNRRAFMRELSKQLSFCYRYETRACLIYMDLDQFKMINDRFGHSTGDAALKTFGEILIAHTRESDLIGRLGGDEFAILLINADEAAGRQKAAMFAEDVEKLQFGNNEAPLGFGLSCGVVEWKRGEPADKLINRADEAMYAEKRTRQTRSGLG